jgi:hypothetical protein
VNKGAEMTELLKKTGLFKEQLALKDEKKCPICKNAVNETEFTDQISIDEFKITGLCQKCQDDVFNNEDDEE